MLIPENTLCLLESIGRKEQKKNVDTITFIVY